MKSKLSRESIKAIMAKHGVKSATPAQMRGLLNYEAGLKAKQQEKTLPHFHHLVGYWGGWYCRTPNCTVKKYQKLKPNS